jgi:hypothetical protein
MSFNRENVSDHSLISIAQNGGQRNQKVAHSPFSRAASRVGYGNRTTVSMREMSEILDEMTNEERHEDTMRSTAFKASRDENLNKYDDAMQDYLLQESYKNMMPEKVKLAWEVLPERDAEKYDKLLTEWLTYIDTDDISPDVELSLEAGDYEFKSGLSGRELRKAQSLKRQVDHYNKKITVANARKNRELARKKMHEDFQSDIDLNDDTGLKPADGLAFEMTSPGLVKIVGMSRNRKSHLAMHLAGTMRATGGNVLYWHNEGSPAMLVAKHKGWKKRYELPEDAGSMHVIPRDKFALKLTDDESISRFIEKYSSFAPSMIIIDALVGTYDGKQNDNDDMSVVEDALLRIKEEMNTIVVAITNTGKDVAKGIRGGQVQFDKADTIIAVETKRGRDGNYQTTATYLKQKEFAEGMPIKFQWEEHFVNQGGETVGVLVPVVDTNFDWKDAFIDYIKVNGASSYTDIQKNVKNSEGKNPSNKAMGLLKELVTEGELCNDGQMRYALVEF